MKTIRLTRGYVALVDDKDYDRVNQYQWYAAPVYGSDRIYARRTDRTDGGSRTILMHRFILGVTDRSIQVDHRNRDGLDNQNDNLRKATPAQNRANSKLSASKLRGVQFRQGITQRGRSWSARIRENGRDRYIGTFCTELGAAAAYNASAHRLYGEFARMNDLSVSHE